MTEQVCEELYDEQLLQEKETISDSKLQIYIEDPSTLQLTFLEEVAIKPGFHGVATLIFSKLDFKTFLSFLKLQKGKFFTVSD